jgi:putative DNA primase/helicase
MEIRDNRQQLIDNIGSNLPQELRDKKIWTLWQLETRPGSDKPTKVPYSPRLDGTIGPASSINPDTWATFEDVCTALQTKTDGIDCGIGCFNDGTYAFIDLDDCIDADGSIEPWASTLIERIDTYCELSPSGRGAHLFLRGSIPGDGRKINGIEMYCRARYFTVTGNPITTRSMRGASPDELETLRGEIAADTLRPYQKTGPARAARTGSAANIASSGGIVLYKPLTTAEREEKLNRALANDLSDYGDDRSAAVHGTLQVLARKYDGDEEAIREAFEASELCVSWGSKWDRLGDKEIAKAIEEWKKNGSPSWESSTPDTERRFRGPKVEGTPFDFVINPAPGYDDGWFPRGDISLVAGSSGAGKTTWTLDLLCKQQRGELVLGRTTNKLDYLVFLADRGSFALQRTMHRMKIDLAEIPHVLLKGGGDLIDKIDAAINERGIPAVIFLEGIDLLGGDMNSGLEVAVLLDRLYTLAEHYHVAIIGSTGCPKMKPKDAYTSVRDRLIGSAVWGRKVETVVMLQRENGKETDEVTLLTVVPRNAPTEEFQMKFQQGRLHQIDPHEVQKVAETATDKNLLEWVMKREVFTRREAQTAFPNIGGGQLTKKLDGLVNAGLIKGRTRGGKSHYFVPGNAPDFVETATVQ